MKLSKHLSGVKHTLDWFGSSVNFQIKGRETYGTYCGALTSIGLLVILLFYT